MHPNKAFRFEGEDAMRAFVSQHGFTHLFAATPAGLMVAHVPLIAARDGHFRFHIARANRMTTHLDGGHVLASIAGPDGYISPDWYAEPLNQVPTWNYAAVEIEATCHALGEADLVAQTDELSRAHEERLAPKPVWTRDKVEPARLAAMYRAIQAFELRPTSWRGTRKLSQNKSQADRAGVIAALGDGPLARAMHRAADQE
jgi:transcriptional regulator